jgi:hypothetical protein
MFGYSAPDENGHNNPVVTMASSRGSEAQEVGVTWPREGFMSKVVFWVGVVALVGAIGWSGTGSPLVPGAAAAVQAAQHAQQAPSTKPRVAPHPQADLPALELPKFELTRSKEKVREIYKFAAEHPEVLHYVPCFCGCNHEGHTSNEDCFVKSRAGNGDVTAWNDHGMMCPMCLAIADRSMQLFEAGVPDSRIRQDIDKTYTHTGEETATPKPPKSGGGRVE